MFFLSSPRPTGTTGEDSRRGTLSSAQFFHARLKILRPYLCASVSCPCVIPTEAEGPRFFASHLIVEKLLCFFSLNFQVLHNVLECVVFAVYSVVLERTTVLNLTTNQP
jgi:hypothetical protein